MKNIGLFLVSVTSFFIIIGCFFYNSLLLDMDKMKDYVTESNLILEEMIKNKDEFNDKKGDYISRLIKIKKGMKNAQTSFLFEKYKVIKISEIELMIQTINESNKEKKQKYLNLVYSANNESEKELDTLINRNFIEVTYLSLKSYINIK